MSKRGSGGAVPQKRDMSGGKRDARIPQRDSAWSVRTEGKTAGARRSPSKGAVARAGGADRLNTGRDPRPRDRPTESSAPGAANDETLSDAERAALRRAEAEIAAGRGAILPDLLRSLDQ
jgi:hypothetical protein